MDADRDKLSDRIGMQGINRRVLMEFVGAMALILILGLIIVHFLGPFGCFMNEECMEAREELRRFVNDVDKACQDASVEQVAGETLEEYDFGASHVLAIGATSDGLLPDPRSISKNEFILIKFNEDRVDKMVEDLASFDGSDDPLTIAGDEEVVDWMVSETASSCNKAEQCQVRDAMHVKEWTCGEGPFSSWLFPIMGGSEGEVRITTYDPDAGPRVKLRYIGDNSIEGKARDAWGNIKEAVEDRIDNTKDKLEEDTENRCGVDGVCRDREECRTGEIRKEGNDDQCGGDGEICCQPVMATP